MTPYREPGEVERGRAPVLTASRVLGVLPLAGAFGVAALHRAGEDAFAWAATFVSIALACAFLGVVNGWRP